MIGKLHTNVTYQMKVSAKTPEIKSTIGVKQGNNLGPILFILINAIVEMRNKKWTLKKPDF